MKKLFASLIVIGALATAPAFAGFADLFSKKSEEKAASAESSTKTETPATEKSDVSAAPAADANTDTSAKASDEATTEEKEEAPAPRQAGVEIGKPAPDYTFTDIGGTSHTLSKRKGRIVVLEWTNPGCPFVKKFYSNGDMQRIQREAKKNPDVLWFAINSSGKDKEGYFSSDEEASKDVAARQFAGDAYVRDPEGTFGKLYSAKVTPHMFVIDKEGNVAYAGAIDSIKSTDVADIAKADNYVLKAIEALAEGKKPKVSSTDAYGCGVKYAD